MTIPDPYSDSLVITEASQLMPVFTSDQAQLLMLLISQTGGDAWELLGNAGTVDGTDFLGTTDDVPLTLRVFDEPVFRAESGTDPEIYFDGGTYPNFVLGSTLNSFTADGGSNWLHGYGSEMLGSVYYSSVDNGWANIIDGTGGNPNDACKIGNGYDNRILGAASTCTILNGWDNTLETSNLFCDILNGDTNTIRCRFGAANTIINGFDNSILGDDENTITNGAQNLIGDDVDTDKECVFAFIENGAGNSIFGSWYAGILNGKNHTIDEDADYAIILGGESLQLGANSVGFQALGVRAGPTLAERNLSAFSGIFYPGDLDIWVPNTDGTARKVKYIEPNTDLDFSSANYSSFRAQAQSANLDYIWPATAPTANQVLKCSAASAPDFTLSWATPSSSGANSGPITTKTATYSAAISDFTILCDATGGAITINLPAAASSAQAILCIKKIDNSVNAVTLDGNASETIDGSTTKAISTQYQSYTVQCDGSAWYIQ